MNPGPPADTSAGWQALRQQLDAEALERLKELDPSGSNGLILRVFKVYDTTLSRLLRQFVEARAANDLAGLRYVAHTVKSSSAYVGALKLSRLCAEIERMLQLQQTEGIDPLLDDMVLESNLILAALKRVLPPSP